ncbi:hypothetical protein EVAR_814_1 [Eumeta japonica]|uniref:Uncharacterized protein n=1 Tax=Eumeta variegata TaxID=151549 RepID=A0A4C1SC34_EUMVA|nr:hypothetical protein EVAR_814_1 [Eumeta japonica]
MKEISREGAKRASESAVLRRPKRSACDASLPLYRLYSRAALPPRQLFEWHVSMAVKGFFIVFVSRSMAVAGDVCAALLRHSNILYSSLVDTNLLDVLVKKGVFSLGDHESVTGAADDEKCKRFVDVVSKQSAVRWKELCSVLESECPKLYKELVRDRHVANEFKRGRVNLSGVFRDDRPSTTVNNENIDAAHNKIETDRHVIQAMRFGHP